MEFTAPSPMKVWGKVGIHGAVGVQAGKSMGSHGFRARRSNEIAADENLVREVGVIMGIDVDAADLAKDLGVIEGGIQRPGRGSSGQWQLYDSGTAHGNPGELAEDERVAIERRAATGMVKDLPPDFGDSLHPGEGPGAGNEAGIQGAVGGEGGAEK